MSGVTVATVEEALNVQAPNLVSQILALINREDDDDVFGSEEIREGAPTMEAFLEEIRTPAFRRKSAEEQASYRQEQVKVLESPDAEVPLEERYRAHEILLKLWATPNDSFARQTLLDLIRIVDPMRRQGQRIGDQCPMQHRCLQLIINSHRLVLNSYGGPRETQTFCRPEPSDCRLNDSILPLERGRLVSTKQWASSGSDNANKDLSSAVEITATTCEVIFEGAPPARSSPHSRVLGREMGNF